jgi:hypothetical protein
LRPPLLTCSFRRPGRYARCNHRRAVLQVVRLYWVR